MSGAAKADIGSCPRKVGDIEDVPAWWIVRVSLSGRRKTICSVRAPTSAAAVQVAEVSHDPVSGYFVAEPK